MAADRRPRIGIVGLGWWCRTYHLPNLCAADGCDVVAVCDADAARVDAARAAFAIEHGFADADALFGSGLVDAVVVATPHDTHYPLAAAALGAGLDVFVEKPLALRASEARDLVARTRAAGRELMVGYTHQFSPIAERLRERLAAGGLGTLVHVAGLSANCLLPLLEGRSGDAVFGGAATATTETYSSAARGGGQAHSQATHGLGLVLHVTGLRPVAVSAAMNTLDLPVDLSVTISIACEGGATIALSSVGTIPRGLPEQQEYRYYGTEGYVLQDLLARTASVFGAGGEERWESGETDASAAAAPVLEFVRLLARGGRNQAPVEPAAAVVEVLEAAHRSHAESRVVRVDEL